MDDLLTKVDLKEVIRGLVIELKQEKENNAILWAKCKAYKANLEYLWFLRSN